MTPEQFRTFCLDQLSGVLSMPFANLVESKVQRALLSAAIAYLSTAPVEEIARMQAHYVPPT